ncbi:helix-turn-helix domain-containing protein [Streptomyces albus]|uniref:helix-turn-helix domain-containing protein n=1 Tax=Streptomyces albus TaxID=1888 RepID=UPI003408A63B
MSDRPLLTQREAAAACDVSRTTIRRRREAGEFPGAVQVDGTWKIPVEDLLAAGLRLHAPAPPDPAPEPRGDQGQGEAMASAGAGHGPGQEEAIAAEIERLRTELAQAREELTAERTRRLVAETEANERAEHIANLQMALTALVPALERAAIPAPAAPTNPVSNPGSVPVPAAPADPAETAETQQPAPRRRWWGGRR